MPVQVLEAVLVYETVILRLVIGRAAGRDSLSYDLIYLFPGVKSKRQEHFSCFSSVADCLGCELLEFFTSRQHGEDILVDDHAGSGFIRELLVECKAEIGEKFFRLL
jgi:hypothetical protein